MPNHVTNEIRVVGGTNKQRLAFIRAITNKFGLIDFNNICKRPKSTDTNTAKLMFEHMQSACLKNVWRDTL